MFLLVSHQMNDLFAKACPFDNKSEFDTPIYQSSISVFSADVKVVDHKILFSNAIEHVGWLPYCNLYVSNKSEHPILKRKTVANPMMFVGCEKYKVESLWAHKALYCFNDNIVNDSKISFKNIGSRMFSNQTVKKLVKDGSYRDMICPVINPLWKSKNFYGINIHRGPKQNQGDWNYSLGCITVEQDDFDCFMKNIEINEFGIYIHNIEQILCHEEYINHIVNKTNGTLSVQDLYSMINSRTSLLRRKND